MKSQYFFKPTKITLISVIIAILSISMYFIANFYFFPKEIKILADIESSFDFKLPISATIEAESVEVLNVNNSPVKDNINVNLAKSFSIELPKASSVNMTLNLFGIPIKTVTVESLNYSEVVPGGMTVGVRINTEGVMVLGTGFVNSIEGGEPQPSKDLLKSGDLILEANGITLENKEMLTKIIEESESDTEIKMKVKRDDKIIDVEIKPVISADDKKNKIGVWIRDSTQGIGTITYYNPENGKFGALGHGILDVDTKTLMSVKDGNIMTSNITSVKKSKKGTPGELEGKINTDKKLGKVETNTAYGVYGKIDKDGMDEIPGEKMEIALQGDIYEGPAIIRSNIKGNEIEEYDVYIETINKYSNDDSKGMVVRIVDPKLLQATNGIVQGMSGSPIIQDGKLIGAITHVFVQDPSKGYGIFIENMLKQSELNT